ncbi:MAG: hypothetical protein C0608_09205 [Deltaproteobacteria bacterium]|nr:MAG: hypothetical protein C0608_09205 [Deltaproteobacteria bacterium]
MKRIKIALLILALTITFAVQSTAFSQTGMARSFHAMGDPYPRITHQVFAYIEGRYVDPDRAEAKTLLEGAFRALETRFPPVLINERGTKADVIVGADSKEVDTEEGKTMLGAAKVLNDVLSFVSEKLAEEAKKDDIYYTALNGAVSQLDPHSNVINPKAFKDFMIGTQGSFGGIGFIFGLRDGEMTIISPIEDTPAARQGLRSGDKILFIDGEPTINMLLDTAKWKMRGDPGTEVTLTLQRDGWDEPRDFTFTREVIHVVSVESYLLESEGKPPVLYVKVKNFQKATTDELTGAIAAAQNEYQDLAGIVMDLRNNPGGLLDQAIELSDSFMSRGAIVSTRGRNERETERSMAVDDPSISDLPLIVLLNQGSASASEIVAGALRDYRALLIGDKTFGKGSVQKLFPLPDRGALKLTIAQYLTPNDVSIQSIGIQPDIYTYGANVKDKRVRIGEPPAHNLEADLENAFTEWGNADFKPWQKVQYLVPSDDDMAGGDDAPHEMGDMRSFAELSQDEKLERLEKDFLISLSRQVIYDVPADERENAEREVLKKAALIALEKARAEEEGKITTALGGVGVDWSAGTAAHAGELKVTVGDFSLNAGETSDLVIKVTNVGSETVHRVQGRTSSDNPMVNNIDFVFGKIAPGEEVSWTTSVKAPKSINSRWDPVTISLDSDGDLGVAAGEGSALSRSGKLPDYQFAYTVVETNDDEALSNNGRLDVGDHVTLTLDVINRGEGASRKTEVNIRGESADDTVFLRAARHSFDEFAPGAEVVAPMEFDVKKADDEGFVKLVVTISDTDFGVALSDILKFTVGETFASKDDRFPPRIYMDKLPPLRTAMDKVRASIRVKDDEEVKELYAYLGDKKIFYKRADAKGSFDASFDVELEEGSNFFTVTAADNEGIFTTRSFHIYRAEGGEELALGNDSEH